RCIFIRKAHNPAVGVSPLDRYIEHLSGQYVGGADAAADHGGPGTVDPGIRPLGPAETEFHDAVASGCINYPGSFGGDQRLLIDHVQNSCLQKLCLHYRSDDFHQWLPGEYYGSFRNGIDISGKVEAPQILQKIVVKQLQIPEVVDIVR